MFKQFKQYISDSLLYRKRKKAYDKLKRQELACFELFLDGAWKITDDSAREVLKNVRKGLEEYKNEKYYTEKVVH